MWTTLSWLLRAGSSSGRQVRPPPHYQAQLPVAIVVEGIYDATFLKHVSRVLHAGDPGLPDLGIWEQTGRCVLLPIGGGDDGPWRSKLAALQLPQFHLYDREVPPVTQLRQRYIGLLQARPRCQAMLTQKRSLENYLHSAAVREALGIDLNITDDLLVAEAAAQALFEQPGPSCAWHDLPARARRHRRERAKKLLSMQAAECLTAEQLAERDPAGEVASWLQAIRELASSN